MLDSCRYLQQRGFDVTYLPVEKNGLINLDQLAETIRPDTSLVGVDDTACRAGCLGGRLAMAHKGI